MTGISDLCTQITFQQKGTEPVCRREPVSKGDLKIIFFLFISEILNALSRSSYETKIKTCPALCCSGFGSMQSFRSKAPDK
jgi:hypothetical protein